MDDTISRQDAIDAIKKCGEPFVRLFTNDFYVAIKAVERVPSAQQWVPVTERLPKENETVIVTDHGEWVDLAFYDGLRWWYRDGGEGTDGVTAWMPLPAPMKGGES